MSISEDTAYIQWGIVGSVVEQLNNYYDTHGEFPDCYTDLRGTPEPNGTLPYAPDRGDYHIHNTTIEDGHLQFSLNAPESLTPDSYHDWNDHEIGFPIHSRFVDMLKHGTVGAPILHQSEHGYTLDLPVEIPEQEREPTNNRVLSVDLGVKKQATAVVVDDTDWQIAPPEIIDHPSEQKLFRLTTEAENINDRLAGLRHDGEAPLTGSNTCTMSMNTFDRKKPDSELRFNTTWRISWFGRPCIVSVKASFLNRSDRLNRRM